MRQGKDHMEIRGIDHFGTALVNPDLLIHSLAVGTVTVAAGIIMCFGMPALCTDTDVAAACPGSAAYDGPCCFLLDFRLGTAPFTEGIIRSTEDILNHEIRHGWDLPAGQKD